MVNLDLNRLAFQSPQLPESPTSGTPTKNSPVAPPARRAFLEDTMGRADLFKLCCLLDEMFKPGNWAFTGSTALMIHARDANQADLAFTRTPSDADIMVKQYALDMFDTTGLPADAQSKGLALYDDKAHVLSLWHNGQQAPLKIDLIKSGASGFCRLEKEGFEQVQEVPVLSLRQLETSLDRRIRANEGTDHSQGDLQLVRKLIDRSNRGGAASASPEHQMHDSNMRKRLLWRLGSPDADSARKKIAF